MCVALELVFLFCLAVGADAFYGVLGGMYGVIVGQFYPGYLQFFEAESAFAHLAVEVNVFVGIGAVVVPAAYFVADAFGPAVQGVQKVVLPHNGKAAEDARLIERRNLCLDILHRHRALPVEQGLQHQNAVSGSFYAGIVKQVYAFLSVCHNRKDTKYYDCFSTKQVFVQTQIIRVCTKFSCAGE